MRLYLDQMFRVELADILRDNGHDVVRASEVGQGRSDDAEILDFVVKQRRVLITLDEHFGNWVVLPLSRHPGVIPRLKIHPPLVKAISDRLIPFLEPGEVAELKALYDELHAEDLEKYTNATYAKGLFASTFVNDLAYRQKVSDGMRDIFHRALDTCFKEYKVFTCGFMTKLPDPDTAFPPHQDFSLFDEDRFTPLTLWCPPQDMDETNGALEVVKGSHRFPHRYRAYTIPSPFKEHSALIQQYAEPLYVQVGTAILFTHATFHSSQPNRSGRARIVASALLAPEQARIQTVYRSPEASDTIDLFDHDDDFFLRHTQFTEELAARPKIGRCVGTVPYREVSLYRAGNTDADRGIYAPVTPFFSRVIILVLFIFHIRRMGAVDLEKGWNGIQVSACNFCLPDQDGREHTLYGHREARVVILISHGIGCPIVRKAYPDIIALHRKYAPEGVVFYYLNANPQDSRAELAVEKRDYKITFPLLKDSSQQIAGALGYRRTADYLLIDPATWRIVYRGPLDDRLGYGTEKQEAKYYYLRAALDAFLTGRKVDPAYVPAKGCIISYE